MKNWPHLTGKYVISPIDNKRYCRKNGQFLKHLKTNGYQSYQDFFEQTYSDLIKYCSCGKKCVFRPNKMEYYQSCGNRNCVGKITSLTKQQFDSKKWEQQHQRYKQTMNQKSVEELGEIVNARKQTNLDRYGVDHPWKNKRIRKKIEQTMLKKHGMSNFSSTLIPKDSKKILEDRQWLYNEHVTKQIPLYVIAKMLDVSDRTVGVHLHNHGIPTHSFQRSMWEKELEGFLIANDVEFITNTTSVIYPKELDFYLPQYNIGIELCGLYWHSEKQERLTKHYHANKQAECNKKEIQLLTIFEDEWETKEIIFSKILHLTNKNIANRNYARQLSIDFEVSREERKQFLNTFHIQQDGKGTICYGLRKNNNELVAVMLFAKTSNSDEYTLNRFCTNGVIVGGFSKLLHYFKLKCTPRKIITFADKRWSDGKLYQKNGFVFDKLLPPDYMYVINGKRVHKFNFRHKSIKKRLPNYDPNKSERDNCFTHGLYRIWDCGKMRYAIDFV